MVKIIDIRTFTSLAADNADRRVVLSKTGGAEERFAPDFSRHEDKNWSDQELAEFYRVIDIFAKYGLTIVTDSGLTDEMDPWFVYCNDQGEVFAHFCKIDGLYFLDSPKFSSPITAFNLRDLVDRFSEEHLKNNERLKNLKENVVVLHPSILFTSLILALYVASDSGTSSARADTPAMPDADGLIGLNLNWQMPKINAEVALPETSTHKTTQKSEPDHKLDKIKSPLKFNLADHEFNISLSAIAGLAAILASSIFDRTNEAVLHSEDAPEQTAQQTKQRDDRSSSKSSDQASDVKEAHNFKRANEKSLIDETVEASKETPITFKYAFNTNEKALQSENNLASDLSIITKKVAAPSIAIDETSHGVSQEFLTRPSAVALNATKDKASSSEEAAHSEVGFLKNGLRPLTSKSDNVAIVNVSDISDFGAHLFNSGVRPISNINSFNSSMAAEFKPFSDLSLRIFENDAEKLAQSYNFSDPGAASSKLPIFNELVTALIDFVLSKGDKITIVNTPREIIFVDNTALNSTGEYVTARSWVTKDSGVISLIGFSKDFMSFDLLKV